MAELKAHAPTAADLNPVDSDRGESGAGIVVAVLACLLVLGLLAGGGVVGLVLYVGHVRQLQEEQARFRAVAKMERIQAELAAELAKERANRRQFSLQQAMQKLQADDMTGPPSAEVAPAANNGENKE